MWAKHLNLVCFRGFKSLDLDLDRPLTVLIGANGSGKTSVLRAVASAQSWLLSIYNRRHELPGVELDERDLRLGATHGEILTRWRHGAYDFGFRVWWSAEEPKWQGFFHESSSNELFREAGRPYLFLVGTDRHVARADVRSARPMGGGGVRRRPR